MHWTLVVCVMALACHGLNEETEDDQNIRAEMSSALFWTMRMDDAVQYYITARDTCQKEGVMETDLGGHEAPPTLRVMLGDLSTESLDYRSFLDTQEWDHLYFTLLAHSVNFNYWIDREEVHGELSTHANELLGGLRGIAAGVFVCRPRW
jgi:hypothetical protein